MINQQVPKLFAGLFILLLATMAWFYSQGYANSIGWEVTTSAEVIPFTGIKVEGQLMDFHIKGDKYLLTEDYSGGPITRNKTIEFILVSLAWLGLGLALVSASFLKRFGFITAIAVFVLFINRLNLNEIGLFNSTNPFIVGGIPFILFVGPLFYFHEYRPKINFYVRIGIFLLSSILLVFFGPTDRSLFLDHFISHSTFSFAIAGVLFLFAITEENIFAILFLVTRTKGGKSNHIHFISLSLIYLINLILYYLNKSGFFPNSFSFFDPFILLIISSGIALWSLKYKTFHLRKYFPEHTFMLLLLGLGILFVSFLSLEFQLGNDAIYESFHYLILYAHIGFGVFFSIYIFINFIDPLIGGFELYKIVYNEQNFPYASARLGGLVVILGFYFLSSQEAYSLLKSGYYVHLANKQETLNHADLATEYFQEATIYGYNTHYANYSLAWNYSDKGDEYLTKSYFERAAARYPSPYAYVNQAMLDREINSVKAQATLDQASQKFPEGEILNNQGTLRMKRKDWSQALDFFKEAEAGDAWNQAPVLNKWSAHYQLNDYDSISSVSEFKNGNFGVRANILVGKPHNEPITDGFTEAAPLHRQAYLLNALSVFEDTLFSYLAINELNTSINAGYNDRLRQSLVIHYYLRGDINKSFRMMDYMQANTYKNGRHLNDLGILSIDQKAYELALDFFEKALEAGFEAARIHRLEALAALNRAEEIPDELTKIVKKDPGLTNMANQLLDRLKTSKFEDRSSNRLELDKLSNDSLIFLANRNAFNEELVLRSVSILNDRNVPEAYDIILEATEINPYSSELLQSYVMTALGQNLIGYAKTALPKIKELSDSKAYSEFIDAFNLKVEEVSKEDW